MSTDRALQAKLDEARTKAYEFGRHASNGKTKRERQAAAEQQRYWEAMIETLEREVGSK